MARLLSTLALVFFCVPAEGKMMGHYDLAGLIVKGDAVVIAERVGPPANPSAAVPLSRYKVVRSLRGPLVLGEEIAVYDAHYQTAAHRFEDRVVLFLGTFEGQRQLLPSGLRVLEHGKVFRFEQRNNPGPYEPVPQGNDPEDQWGNGTAQLDLAGLERAITAAGARVAALATAKAEPDPARRRAKILALFPAGQARSTGFYEDQLAEEARVALAKAGDLEGALLVGLRDRSGVPRDPDYATGKELVAIARDAGRAAVVRAAALDALAQRSDLTDDPATLRAVLSLIVDPAPEVRAAAVAAAARPAQMRVSEAALQRRLDALIAEARTAIGKQYRVEQDNRVLAAILEAYENSFRKPPPAHLSGPLAAARVNLEGVYVNIDLYCLRPTKWKESKVTARTGGAPVSGIAYNVRTHCGNNPSTGTGVTQRLAAGRYDLAVELATRPPTTLALGALVIGVDGERQLLP